MKVRVRAGAQPVARTPASATYERSERGEEQVVKGEGEGQEGKEPGGAGEGSGRRLAGGKGRRRRSPYTMNVSKTSLYVEMKSYCVRVCRPIVQIATSI